MTALNEYERLESTGAWRATPDAQLLDVIVSIGDATMTISDHKDTALSHWSLPAIERINPGERPALFRPGPDAFETLELDEDIIIQAISKVQRAIECRRPHPGRLRYLLTAALSALVLGLAVFWLPGAMINYTGAVVPAVKRTEIGQNLLSNIRRVAGEPCENALGKFALQKLQTRLLEDTSGSVVVLSGGVNRSQHLPGNIILLNRSLVEDHEVPAVPAGFILAEDQRASDHDPLLRLLQDRGIFTAFRLLTTGDIPDDTLAAYAESLLTTNPSPVSDQAMLVKFAQTSVPSTPYAYAIDISGEQTLSLIEADPAKSGTPVPVLSDGDWISLQGICGE